MITMASSGLTVSASLLLANVSSVLPAAVGAGLLDGCAAGAHAAPTSRASKRAAASVREGEHGRFMASPPRNASKPLHAALNGGPTRAACEQPGRPSPQPSP